MQEFDIKLRNESKKISLKSLKTNCVRIKFKVKGLYKKLKFKAEVSFTIIITNNIVEILNLSIENLDLFENSTSDLFFNNVYTLTTYEFLENDNKIKKIYYYLKNFINSIGVSRDGNQINAIIFNTTTGKIKKLNIRGYLRKCT
jgi:hypothetical protein